MAEKLTTYDPAEDLTSDEAVATFMAEAFQTEDSGYIAHALGVAVDIFHSNSEGAVIDRLYAAHDANLDGAIINPAGFTRGYPALNAAITQVKFPVVEVHISNPARRGMVSEIGAACVMTIAGFGIDGYALALRGLRDRA